MPYTSTIRLRNFINRRNKEVRLSHIKLWEDITPVAISNISGSYNVQTIGDLLIENSNEVSLPCANIYYIDIELTQTVYIEKFLYFQLTTQSGEEYWVDTFEVYYNHNDSGDWRLYNTAGRYIYPGINTPTELPTFSPDALAKTVRWTNIGSNFHDTNGEISELETLLLLPYTSNGNDAWRAQTNQNVVSGKWYFEIHYDKAYIARVLFLLANQWDGDLLNLSPINTGSSSRFLGIYLPSNIVYYRPPTGSTVEITTSSSYAESEISDEILSSQTLFQIIEGDSFLIKDKYIIGVGIDYDNSTITYYNTSSPSPFKSNWIKYSVPSLEGYSNLSVGVAGSSFTTDNDGTSFINLGYYPFRGSLPDGYIPGFGKEVCVNVPAWEQDNRLLMLDTVTGIEITEPLTIVPKITDMEYENIVVNYGNEEKLIDISHISETILTKLSKPIDWVFRKTNQFKMKAAPRRTVGYGYIKSTVSKVMGSTVPIATKVVLIDIRLNKIVNMTVSHPETGEFEFKYLKEGVKYQVLAYDLELGWVSGVGGPWETKRMPKYEGKEMKHLFNNEL